jgi:hypothetical protein
MAHTNERIGSMLFMKENRRSNFVATAKGVNNGWVQVNMEALLWLTQRHPMPL